jgi:1,4-dihydroxy-2-naphthoyl-CoA hydrolase
MDTQQLHGLIPLAATLDIRLAEATPGRVVCELDHRPELCTAGGILHGGALMTLADTGGAVCAFLNLPDGAAGTTTVESKTNLLAAARDGVVTATSTPLHAGRRFVVIETELRAGERLVAKTTQTQAVLRP